MPNKKPIKPEPTEQILHNVETITSKTEQFLYKNSKALGIGLISILVLVAGYFLYIKFYQEPNEIAVFEKSITADQYFEKDSLEKALNGKGYLGYIQLAERYSNTAGGNLAKYKAGIALFNTGKYQESIKYLEDFDTDEEVLSALKYGAIADCYVELGNKEKAVENYQKAIEESKIDYTKEFFYKKLILFYLTKNELAKADELMKELFLKVPESEDNIEFQKLEQYIKYRLDGNS